MEAQLQALGLSGERLERLLGTKQSHCYKKRGKKDPQQVDSGSRLAKKVVADVAEEVGNRIAKEVEERIGKRSCQYN